MAQLITPNDISALARPCYADVEIANKAIDEAIDIDLRYLVGDSLFEKLITSTDVVLLNGGKYEYLPGKKRIIGGLRKAIAYLAYSRVVKFGNALPTRFGTMQNNDQYSVKAEQKERQMIIEDTYNIGLRYVNEVLAYVERGDKCGDNSPVQGKRRVFKIIGR